MTASAAYTDSAFMSPTQLRDAEQARRDREQSIEYRAEQLRDEATYGDLIDALDHCGRQDRTFSFAADLEAVIRQPLPKQSIENAARSLATELLAGLQKTVVNDESLVNRDLSGVALALTIDTMTRHIENFVKTKTMHESGEFFATALERYFRSVAEAK